MQKDNHFYTFLLTHTSKEKIYIRKLEISKRVLHTTLTSLFICVGITSLGVFGLTRTDAFNTNANSADSSTENPTVASKPVKPTTVETSPINYDRPSTDEDLAQNSGGPMSGSFRLTAIDSKSEETDVEKKLALIEKTSNPRFLPTIWAHLGKINNEFGFRRNPFGGRSYEFHAGMDIDGEKGDMLVAPANGVVLKAGWQGGYGNLIEIDHGNGLTTRYGHLSKLEVKIGDTIQRGQLIGLIGSTGRSTGPHLHYELRLDDKAINPRRFLPPEPTEIKG
jgi:murein DD-endopeptidase MepM/ murein hydrolase activator NlpD